MEVPTSSFYSSSIRPDFPVDSLSSRSLREILPDHLKSKEVFSPLSSKEKKIYDIAFWTIALVGSALSIAVSSGFILPTLIGLIGVTVKTPKGEVEQVFEIITGKHWLSHPPLPSSCLNWGNCTPYQFREWIIVKFPENEVPKRYSRACRQLSQIIEAAK